MSKVIPNLLDINFIHGDSRVGKHCSKLCRQFGVALLCCTYVLASENWDILCIYTLQGYLTDSWATKYDLSTSPAYNHVSMVHSEFLS